MEKQPACGHFDLLERRKLCAHCHNPKEDHIFDEVDISELKKILQNIAKADKIAYPISNSKYSWLPPNCPPSRYEEFFNEIPADMVPKINSHGEQNRLKSLFRQIPITDLSKDHSRYVEPVCLADLRSHFQNLKSRDLKFGIVKEWQPGSLPQCPKCLTMFENGELVVMPSLTSLQVFHVACFVCSQCGEYVVDLINCLDSEGNVYCVRHFGETTNKRCHACDELIFALQFSQAGDHFYHRDHLRCFSPKCDLPLKNNKGFEKDGELYCSRCYETYFADECAMCGRRVSIGSKHVAHGKKCWHLNCFTCEKCKNVLSDFEEQGGKFYCPKCYDEDIAPRCKHCCGLFEGHVRVFKYETDLYHVGCFKCFDCKNSIGTNSFIPNNDRIFCKDCYTRNFGIKCSRCKYVITDEQGVMHNKKPYHISCFTCHSCFTYLDSKPFKGIDEEWYCIPCYAKKKNLICQACGTLINLGENDKIYTFDDYKWHAECFICKSCLRSLENSQFAMRGKDLMCPNCCSRKATASANVKLAHSASEAI